MPVTLPCDGCGGVIDCQEDSLFGHFTLSGDPTFPYLFLCPAGLNCRLGGPVSIDCCSHLITRNIPPNATDAELNAIFQDMLAQCRQFQAECSGPPGQPPTGPGPGPPIDPPVHFYFNEPQTCTVLCPDGTGFTATVRQGRVLSSSQAQSNSLALSLACADAQRMRICPSAGLDMPLDQAVWVPTQNALVGVRGGYLFRFDANGMFQSKSRFSKMTLYGSSICYDSTRDRLFVATKDDPGWEGDLNAGTTYSPFRVIRRIDPATFTVEATFSPDTFFSNNAGVGNSGPMRVLAVGGLIYCSYSLGNGNIITNDPGFVGVFDPSGLTLSRQTQAFLEDGWCEIVDLNANYWMATDIGSGVIQIFSKPSVGDPFGNPVDFITAREIASALLKMPCGACIDPGSTNIFMVCRDSQFVMRRDSTVGGAHAGMDIALPAGSTPYCARYGLGKVYVAGLSNDTVSIINPADNSVANKTGFDGPFDIVFTPTKAFAVQIGQQGLKEIV